MISYYIILLVFTRFSTLIPYPTIVTLFPISISPSLFITLESLMQSSPDLVCIHTVQAGYAFTNPAPTPPHPINLPTPRPPALYPYLFPAPPNAPVIPHPAKHIYLLLCPSLPFHFLYSSLLSSTQLSQLYQLYKLAAAYGDVIPMIEADRQMADAPGDAANKTAFQSARRKAFATLAALFDWK